jgi:YmgD family uncharacterized protein
MTSRISLSTLLAAVILGGTLAVGVSADPSSPVKTTRDVADVLPLTCAQAWVMAHKSYPAMISIVRTLARVSLANRDLTFPNTREAGRQAGRGIAEDCKADPHGLLFAMVDKHVRQVAEAASK